MDSIVLAPTAIDSNRAGRLTDWQLQRLRSGSRGTRRAGFACFVAGILIAGGLFYAGLLTRIDNRIVVVAHPSVALLIAAGAVLLVALYGLQLAIRGSDSETRDLRDPRIDTVDGYIRRRTEVVHTPDGNVTTWFIAAGSREWSVPSEVYETAPDAGYFRVYFLDRSADVVNFERLPDPPTPQDPTAIASQVEAAMSALTARDPEKVAEARGQLDALAAAFLADAHDGLATAAVGAWTSQYMALHLRPDGSMSGSSGSSAPSEGSWSVSPDGHLCLDAQGKQEALAARVLGDTLLLVGPQYALKLTRVQH